MQDLQLSQQVHQQANQVDNPLLVHQVTRLALQRLSRRDNQHQDLVEILHRNQVILPLVNHLLLLVLHQLRCQQLIEINVSPIRFTFLKKIVVPHALRIVFIL